MDIVGLPLQTKSMNKYILFAIDHYSKWCEASAVLDHITIMVAMFLENEVICQYLVPKFL
jgi:hypothetical protein